MNLTITALKLDAAIDSVEQAKAATSPQYMELPAAKSQERRWRKKLVQAAQEVNACT